MKKVASVLIAICMIAGLASAGYVQIRAVGNTSGIITAATGEILTIEVSVSGFSDQVVQTLALINFDINEQLSGGASAGAASNNAVATSLFDSYSSGSLVNADGTLIRNITASRTLGTTYADPDWAVTDTVVYTFTYTVGNTEGTVALSLADIDNGVPTFGDVMNNSITSEVTVSPLTIVVPEPLTVALMGLGGLFIRRRK